MDEIFVKTATSEAVSRLSTVQLNLRCMSGDKRCRVQFYRGSLQSALRFSAWATLESVLNRLPFFKEGLVSPALPDAKMTDGSALFKPGWTWKLEGIGAGYCFDRQASSRK